MHAVDAAGVHPLLLAIGSERYTPYMPAKQPAELLTIANHILGTGQLSLAKFLFITADDTNRLSTHHIQNFFTYILERIDLALDVHFYTNTTIDTLDYSGSSLNSGSKVVFAAYGEVIRSLCREVPQELLELHHFENPVLVMPGIVVVKASAFTTYEEAAIEMKQLDEQLMEHGENLKTLPILIVADSSEFTGKNLRNFLWVTFTRCNPANDIYGVQAFVNYKHWGCNGPLIIDARIKPHHAPPVEIDNTVERNIERLFN